MNQTGNFAPRSESIVNAEAAAQFLGLSAITLAKWRVTGGGPTFLKLGRSVRYRMADLQTWACGQSHSNTSQYRAS